MIDSYVQIFVSQWGKYHFWLFIKNDTSFSSKQHVTFNKTTRHFQQNNTSLSTKHHVGVESTDYDSKDLFWDFQQKHLEIPQKHTNFAPQSPQGEVWKPE